MKNSATFLLPVFLPLAAISTGAYAAEYLNITQAQQQMFPTAAKFVAQDNSAIEPPNAAQQSALKKLLEEPTKANFKYWRAVSADGKLLGFFFMDNVIGKHDYITYALSLSPQGVVNDLEIMAYRENYGSEIRYPGWRKQFNGKAAKDAAKWTEDIASISGATLSSNHVSQGVKRLLEFYNVALASSPKLWTTALS